MNRVDVPATRPAAFLLAALLGVWMLFAAGCRIDDGAPTQPSGSPAGEAFAQTLDLDAVHLDTVYMDVSTTLAGTTTDSPDEHVPILGEPTSIVIVGDSVYIADMDNNAVLIADRNLNIRRRIGRSGPGPGEFEQLMYIAPLGDSAFVSYEPGRVQLMNLLGEYRGTVAPHAFGSHNNNDGNSHWIFVGSGGVNGNYVNAYASSATDEPPASILKIPEDHSYHPSAYRVAAFSDNSFVFGVLNIIPAVEVFDGNLGHVGSLLLEGSVVDRYRPDPGMGRVPSGSVFASFFTFLRAECDDLLIFGRHYATYFVRQSGTSFELVGSLVFVTEEEEKGIPIWDLRVSRDRVFIVSRRDGAVFSGVLPPDLSCTSAP